jgi:Spy/CpxP family protein refolding chaperone
MKRLVVIIFLAVLSFIAPQAKANQIEAPAPKSADQCLPPAVVASFLGFTEAQAAQFGDLLVQFQTTLHGLQEQIAVRQTQLDILLGQPNPHPAIIGSLFLQIHALQQQVAQVIQSFQSQFSSLLTGEQKQKVQAVTQASQLQPVVGAFVALYLVPAPTPLPCQKQ